MLTQKAGTAALVLALLASGALAEECGPPPVVPRVEAALSAALSAPAGAAREAALAEATKLIAEGGDGSPEIDAYLRNRAAARAFIAAGALSAAKERLAAFDFRPLARKVAEAAAEADCPPGETETALPGAGDGLGEPATAPDRFDMAGAAPLAALGPAKTPEAASGLANKARALKIGADRLGGLLLAFLVAAPAAAFVAHRVKVYRRRREGRYLCYIPAALAGQYRDETAIVVDFSRSGARLALDAHIVEIGEEVEIDYAGLQRAAHVRWVRRRSVGIQLDEPLSDEAFDKVMDAARAGAGVDRA
ncbi:MAG: PilZ domain-containing protein [Pikeienuella sp.]|uniref:PilZ domain-containing protein n=1 Tax=Pikeienuella sp. TaxID=2831957 RepID=UPI00391B5CE7